MERSQREYDDQDFENLRFLLGAEGEPEEPIHPAPSQSHAERQPRENGSLQVQAVRPPSLVKVTKLQEGEVYLYLAGWRRSRYFRVDPAEIMLVLTRNDAIRYLNKLVLQRNVEKANLQHVSEQNSSLEAASIVQSNMVDSLAHNSLFSNNSQAQNIEQELLSFAQRSGQEQQRSEMTPVRRVRSYLAGDTCQTEKRLDLKKNIKKSLSKSIEVQISDKNLNQLLNQERNQILDRVQPEQLGMLARNRSRGSELSGITDNNVDEREAARDAREEFKHSDCKEFLSKSKLHIPKRTQPARSAIEKYDVKSRSGRDILKQAEFLRTGKCETNSLSQHGYLLPEIQKMQAKR